MSSPSPPEFAINPIQESQFELNTLLPTPAPNKDYGIFGQFSLKKLADNNSSKNYTCSECYQTFSKAHNLKSHKATHSASKPFQCSDCDKQFLRLYDLRRHQKLHTGEKPFQCDVCNRSFSRSDALHRHKKTESNYPPCLKLSSPATKPSDIPPLVIPPMTSQWQVSTNEPPPVFPRLSSYNQPKPISASSSPSSSTIKHDIRSPQQLPFILPLNENTDEIERLKQKIYDLEIENRVLRSLIRKDDTAEGRSP
ncbi:hypothetical protein BDB01DRAFT_495091 [Pilobolus umbonatus]|nr:hypothetical protein BDB01DRAFT_495091 [Pilobolus umbonatus]